MSKNEDRDNRFSRTCPVKPPSIRPTSYSPSPRKNIPHSKAPQRCRLERNSFSNTNLNNRTAPSSPRQSMYRNRSFSGSAAASDNYLLPSHSEEMQDLKYRAMNHMPLDCIEDDEGFNELIYNLQYERKKYALRKNYGECKKYSEAVDYVKGCKEKIHKDGRNYFDRSVKEEAEERNEETLRKFDEQTTKLFEDLEKKIEADRVSLINRHNDEIAEHNTKWLTKKTEEYEHPSAEILNTQEKIDSLVQQSRFEEAESMQRYMDELKKQNQESRTEQRKEAFNISLSALLRRQQMFMDEFDRQAGVQRLGLEMKRKVQREHIQNRQKKLTAPKTRRSGNIERDLMTINGIPTGPMIPSTNLTKAELKKESNKLKLPQLDTSFGRRSIRK